MKYNIYVDFGKNRAKLFIGGPYNDKKEAQNEARKLKKGLLCGRAIIESEENDDKM